MKDMKIDMKGFVHERKEIEQNDKKLKKACKEFESVFTYELLKSMRKSVDKTDLFHGGQGEEIYQSLLDQEYAKKMAGGGANSLAELLYQQLKGAGILNRGPGEEASGRDLFKDPPLWPISGRISSKFGWREDPINGDTRFHRGIDFAAQEGTLVRAALPGRVIRSDFESKYGNMVLLDHGHGLTTLYAHNKGNVVKEGDWVNRGTVLARVGSTGKSTGPHLHFEVRKNGEHLDPNQLIEEGIGLL